MQVPGDINGDGVADVDDINEMINTILRALYRQSCDVNNDGFVDVDDLNELINIVLRS